MPDSLVKKNWRIAWFWGGGYGRVHGRIMVTRTFQTKRDKRYIICRKFSRRWFLARNFLAYIQSTKHLTQKSIPRCPGAFARVWRTLPLTTAQWLPRNAMDPSLMCWTTGLWLWGAVVFWGTNYTYTRSHSNSAISICTLFYIFCIYTHLSALMRLPRVSSYAC